MKHSFGKSLAVLLTSLVGLHFITSVCHAVPWKLNYNDAEQIPLQQVTFKSNAGRPVLGTFWSMQRTHFPPLPCFSPLLFEAGVEIPVYVLDAERGVYLLDDRAVDYDALYRERQKKKQEETLLRSLELNMGLISMEEFSLLEGEGGGGMEMMMLYSSTDLWIEIIKVENDNAFLTLHGTVPGWQYQLLTKTNLAQAVRWLPDEIITGAAGTNQTDFSPKNVAGISNEFYRAHTSAVELYLTAGSDGYEGNALVTSNQAGLFTVNVSALQTNNVTFYYQMSGVASNGVDYTNLVGAAVMPANAFSTNISFRPVTDNLLEGKESIRLTLLETNTYLITPSAASGTQEIWDSAVEVYVWPPLSSAVETNGPPGAAAQAEAFTIFRTDQRGLNLPMQVRYSLSGTASNITDYTNLTGVVTFGLGETSKDVFVLPVNDTIIEGDETVTLSLIASNTYVIEANNASATLTIVDTSTTLSVFNDTPATAVEVNGPPGVSAANGVFRVKRDDTRGIFLPMTVSYTLSGTATNGVDYTTLSGSVTFAAGETETNVLVQPTANTIVEPDKTVTLTLNTNESWLIEPTAASATTTIVDTSTTVEIPSFINAIEPNPASSTPKQVGEFTIFRSDTRNELPALTVFYQLTGTAIGGTDYTNVIGSVTIPNGLFDTTVFIDPVFDNRFEPDETVTLTLLLNGDGYKINPAFASRTLTITDNVGTNTFVPVMTSVFPDGIDYHQPSNSLIVSVRAVFPNPVATNFIRIFTNTVGTNVVTALTNWTRITGLTPEVKLFTVKTTANGFTNGDTYFTSGTNIGWISADGTRSNMTWCVLTNAVETNGIAVQGSMVMDTTGIFSNQLIAVTGEPARLLDKKGVWRINSSGQPTLLTNFLTEHLEGVIVLPNNTNLWGPLAGKIVTGDENLNLIHTIAGNGALTTINPTNLFGVGIRTEDFEIIPPNQDLYMCDAEFGKLSKLSRDFLTNHVGELLIAAAGEFGSDPSSLFIVRWNQATTNFITAQIPFIYRDGSSGSFEHITFAPLNLPTLP